MKSTFQKQVPTILNYRDNKRFNNTLFQNDLMYEISKTEHLKTYVINNLKMFYRKQRNYCVSLIRKAKCNFYEHLHPKLICDNRKVWKQVTPFFPTKHVQIVILHFWRMIKSLLIH